MPPTSSTGTTSSLKLLWRFSLVGALLLLINLGYQYFQIEQQPSLALISEVANSPGYQSIDQGLTQDDLQLLFDWALQQGIHLQDPLIRQRLLRNMRFLNPDSEGNDDELFEQSIELELHQHDLVIRRRILQWIENKARRDILLYPPNDNVLTQLLENHNIKLPERRKYYQVYLNPDKTPLTPRIAKLSKQLNDQGIPQKHLGDFFVEGNGPFLSNFKQAQARFGSELAKRLFQLPPHHWSEAITSPYGVHFLYVEQINRPNVTDFKRLRPRLLEIWTKLKTTQLLKVYAQQLRQQNR